MRDDGSRWVRISRGFYLLGFGTFLLLTTQDVLPVSFWGEVAAYWPVLLVALGIRLVFERSPVPALVLLGPLLILGTMMHVALRAPGAADTRGDWTALRLERPAGAPAALTFEGRLAFADLEVQARRLQRNVLVEGRATHSGRHTVRLEGTGAGRVRATNSGLKGITFFVPGRRSARCTIAVASDQPVGFDLDQAFTETRIDFPATPVTGVSFDGAFNTLNLSLGEPSSEVRLDLEGAFNHVVIEVPAGTRVATSSEGFLNLVESKGTEDVERDGAPGYRVRLHGAFNHLRVRPR